MNLDTYQHLNLDDFVTAFECAWERMANQYVKYESRQFYPNDELEAQVLYRSLEFETARQLLNQNWKADADSYAAARLRGIELLRLHSVVLPLTEYLQFETFAFAVRQPQHEDIRYCLETDLKQHFSLQPPDFILFDATVGYVYDQTAEGDLRGAWEVTGPGLDEMGRWVSLINSCSEDFRTFLAAQSLTVPGV